MGGGGQEGAGGRAGGGRGRSLRRAEERERRGRTETGIVLGSCDGRPGSNGSQDGEEV